MNKYVAAVSANIIFLAVHTLFFLVITPIAIRVMGQEFYGLWVILISLMLFSNIGTLGIDTVVNKFSAEAHPEYMDIRDYSGEVLTAGAFIVLLMAGLAAAGLILARGWLAANLNISPVLQIQFRTAVLIIAVCIFPLFLSRVTLGYLLSQLRNKTARVLDVSANISLWTGAVSICLIEKNLVWIAWWCLATYVTTLGVYLIVLNQAGVLRIRINRPLARRIFSFSLFTFMGSLAISLFQQADRILVALVLGPGAAGVYSVGTSVGLRLSLIAGQVTDVMIPYASLKNSIGNHQSLYVVFRGLSRYISLLIAGAGSLLILWMEAILGWWISPEYAQGNARYFSILVLAYSLLSLCRPGHQTLTGLGQVKITSIIYLFSSIAMLGCLYYFSVLYGLLGAASANLIMVVLLVFNLYTYMYLSTKSFLKDLLMDLGTGLLLPTITYLITLQHPSNAFNLIVTFIVAFVSMIVVIRDEFLQALIWKIKAIRTLF